jgi:type IV pilus modification protein PilV
VSNRPDSHTTSGESGFTIVEVMVAMVVLIVGVLGTLVLVQGSLSSTGHTAAREQGTNLARDLVERSRQATYSSVTVTNAASVLAATLPAAEVSGLSGSTFQVTRRGVDYTVQVSACAVDDPIDGAGKGTAVYCAVGTGSNTPGPPPALAAGKVRVLGLDIDVALSGTLLDTVCKAVGTNTDIATTASAVLSPIAPVAICPASGPNPNGAVQIDNDPDDMRRVRVDVSWNRDGAGSVSQTTLLPNPSQN